MYPQLQLFKYLDRKLATETLVRKCGVCESIANHNLTTCQSWQYDSRKVIATSCKDKKRFCQRIHFFVEYDLA